MTVAVFILTSVVLPIGVTLIANAIDRTLQGRKK